MGNVKHYPTQWQAVQITDFEWDEGNVLHLALGHGIEPEATEEVFAVAPRIRKTRRGHYAAFGPTQAGRLMVVVFEWKAKGIVRVIMGWDMDAGERQYYLRHRKG